MTDDRTVRFAGYILAGLVGATCIILMPILLFGWPPSLTGSQVAAGTTAAALAVIWVIFFSARAYGTQDEFQKQRAKTSWYWGSSIGLATSMPIFFFIARGGLHWIDPAIPSGVQLYRSFLIGYMVPVLSIAIGALVAKYWIRHRDV